jgi:lipase chaperone LimK
MLGLIRNFMKPKPIPALTGIALLLVGLWSGISFFADDVPEPAAPVQADLFAFIKPLPETPAQTNAIDAVAQSNRMGIDLRLKKLFDDQLAAWTGQTPEAIRRAMEKELQDKVDPAAMAQARDLMNRYLEYKAALSLLPRADTTSVQGMEADMAAVRQLRATYFGPADNAMLFSADDAADRNELERLRIVQDESLSEEARDARLGALETQAALDLQAINAGTASPPK